MADEHGLDRPVMVGQVQQQDGLLTMVQTDGTGTEIDLKQWLQEQLNLSTVGLTKDDWRLILDLLEQAKDKPADRDQRIQLEKISQLIQMALEQDSSD